MDTRNPSTKECWSTCASCVRCIDKGRYTKCNECSGRHDPYNKAVADPDDYCDCRNGVLRWRTQQGQLIISRLKQNPYKGEIKREENTQDQRDWDSYIRDMSEKFDDPHFNPISLY